MTVEKIMVQIRDRMPREHRATLVVDRGGAQAPGDIHALADKDLATLREAIVGLAATIFRCPAAQLSIETQKHGVPSEDIPEIVCIRRLI
jgi:hypothetical protein